MLSFCSRSSSPWANKSLIIDQLDLLAIALGPINGTRESHFADPSTRYPA